ncbi:MAG: hypothetical protein FJX35_21300 [Alphaproteobacteria bacterium]|nr:hypothetical protein [Alphaproteobacteria bacterium]
MPRVFAVIRSRGPKWNDAVPMEQQEDWRGHADFMNALAAQGFFLLVGPLEGSRDVLLIVPAEDEDEIKRRLAVDCWVENGLLVTARISPWQLRIGSVA